MLTYKKCNPFSKTFICHPSQSMGTVMSAFLTQAKNTYLGHVPSIHTLISSFSVNNKRGNQTN